VVAAGLGMGTIVCVNASLRTMPPTMEEKR
jgi:hypothetical protein